MRRVPTIQLVKSVLDAPSARQHKQVLSELCSRFLGPVMNLILTVLCTLVLLRSSLLRRRASFAPALAVAAMAVVMAGFMSASNMVTSLTDFGILALVQMAVLIILVFALYRK